MALGSLNELDLRHETELVKAALLYADRVTLASPKALLLATVASFGAVDRRTRLDAMAALISEMDPGADVTEMYQRLRRRRRLTLDQRAKLRTIEQILEEGVDSLVETIEGMLTDAGAEELSLGIERGVVELHGLGPGGSPDYAPPWEEMIASIQQIVADSVASDAATFPLFDDGAGGLLRAMLDEGKISDARSRRPIEAGIAGHLLTGLEAFPDADMDVILDVRQRLRAPLINFRAALAHASLEFASEAWDADFQREVEDLHRRQIAPAVEALRQTLDELKVRPTLLRMASSKEGAAGIATLGLTAANLAGLAPNIVYAVSASAAIVTAASETSQRRRIRRQAVGNGFYFIYQASRELGK
jgi:hypothetical protein